MKNLTEVKNLIRDVARAPYRMVPSQPGSDVAVIESDDGHLVCVLGTKDLATCRYVITALNELPELVRECDRLQRLIDNNTSARRTRLE